MTNSTEIHLFLVAKNRRRKKNGTSCKLVRMNLANINLAFILQPLRNSKVSCASAREHFKTHRSI